MSTLDEHAARRQAQGNRLQPSTERPPARHRASGVSRTGVMRGRVIEPSGGQSSLLTGAPTNQFL